MKPPRESCSERAWFGLANVRCGLQHANSTNCASSTSSTEFRSLAITTGSQNDRQNGLAPGVDAGCSLNDRVRPCNEIRRNDVPIGAPRSFLPGGYRATRVCGEYGWVLEPRRPAAI